MNKILKVLLIWCLITLCYSCRLFLMYKWNQLWFKSIGLIWFLKRIQIQKVLKVQAGNCDHIGITSSFTKPNIWFMISCFILFCCSGQSSTSTAKSSGYGFADKVLLMYFKF